MKLGIIAMDCQQPDISLQFSRMGTFINRSYLHLHSPAGRLSRPPAWAGDDGTKPYKVAEAHGKTGAADLASKSVERLKVELKENADGVDSILHCQSTINEPAVASSCLRIQYEHFQEAHSTLTLGQMGTSGISTAMLLANMQIQRRGYRRVLVSASDKWISPFVRHFGSLTTFCDGAGSCLIESYQSNKNYLAEILALAVTNSAPPPDFWRSEPATHADHLVNNAVAAINNLAASATDDIDQIDTIYGEPYGLDVNARIHGAVKEKYGIDCKLHRYDENFHASSAAPLAAMQCALDTATAANKPQLNLIWSASMSGHAGAMLVRCYPSRANVLADNVAA